MAGKTIITIGCKSSHGGIIITGDPIITVCGIPVARIGDLHACPLFYPGDPPPPHAITKIVKGPCSLQNRGSMRVRSKYMAVATDRTACGAILLPCQKCAEAVCRC